MWRLLEQAAKTAKENASGVVTSVQTKAQTLVNTVHDEATMLLQAIGSVRTSPVDEILYEELEDYEQFWDGYKVDNYTDEISKILEEDDEIRDLHEQIVPSQLSYDEFWCRYFFRREQDEKRRKLEEERKKKQREQEEAKAAAKKALGELEDDDHGEDTLSEDEDPERRSSISEKTEATMDQLREARASQRAAAMQWKQKAMEFQKQLRQLADEHEEEKAKLKSEYASLCETYDNKMTEVTLQIDEARAAGYDSGIQESESIIATIRAEADAEIERLTAEVARLQQQTPATSADGTPLERDEELELLRQEKAVLEQKLQALSETQSSQDSARLQQTLQIAQERITQLTQQLTEREEEDGHSAATMALEHELMDVKKEMDLWKARALRMKKMKEEVENELKLYKEDHEHITITGDADPSDPVALLAKVQELEKQKKLLLGQMEEAYERGADEAEERAHEQIEELTAQLHDAEERIEHLETTAYERGLNAGRMEMEEELARLEQEASQAFDAGAANAAIMYKGEIDLLHSELAILRAENASGSRRHSSTSSAHRPSSASSTNRVSITSRPDVLAQADAVLSSIASPGVDESDIELDESWGGEASAEAVTTSRDDWGEW
ncbi:hypothetical protein Poli38472_008622 [Pythium oligandrum]|uniref:BSD domain-containing protein n=1 Tax=Pythium oligandrum TaxID=41045 RepID=A0A8K1C3T0_PYTOL|nr:hypothetical protein Poli38472_008622 [Pythium oligandrum]|eukprot:TMW55974.1 hypothetical protein Poli38472_008622 [Pythium oligandrum]